MHILVSGHDGEDVENLRGKLLVASPLLVDPNFRRSVVLIAEHSGDGAMGVVLTRPSDATVADAVPQLHSLVEDGARVFVGGPVEPAAVVVLAEFDDPDDAAAIVVGDVGFLPAETAEGEAPPTRRARVYAGYAGWGPGQLEDELEQEAWIVARAEPADVFAADTDLWSTALRRKGGQYAILALMPPDPSLN
jgi:putative transcriptional regulator